MVKLEDTTYDENVNVHIPNMVPKVNIVLVNSHLNIHYLGSEVRVGEFPFSLFPFSSINNLEEAETAD